MRLPIEWLRDYVDFEDTVEGLARRLTFSGVEVEGIETVGHAYEGIVVGEVRAVDRHPNADRLTVCRVFDGTAEVQVVCGAPNVQAGRCYPLAKVGATLPNGLKIKAAKLRGVESHGMLCAEDELGLSEDHSGLLEVKGHSAGTPISDITGGPDTVLDLEITPNRPDELSIIGLAREVAALYGKPLKRPSIQLPEAGAPVETLAAVEVRDTERCPRYTARVLTGVKIGPAPVWMQRRLTRAGIRPINNVVDITNYVMLECGHPLHAFDRELLHGGRIIVRTAAPAEVMHTLDDQERKLAPGMLVIADADRPVAVAGVMGGAGSEIRDVTSTVLLESAGFEKSGVRATSRQLGLNTESSYRFARGVDADGAEWASRRAAALMVEHAGATCCRGVIDVYPRPLAAHPLRARTATFERMLGIPCPVNEVVATLKSLQIETRIEGDELVATIPTFRGDLQIEVDLVEEYARMSGLDRIPVRTPQSRIVPGSDERRARTYQELRNHLAGLGLQEIMNYSLTTPALLKQFGMLDDGCVRLPNPLSEEQSVLRPSLLPQLAETLGRNRAHQVQDAAFCEFGRTYRIATGGTGTAETETLAIGLMGAVARSLLQKRATVTLAEMLAWIKGLVEDVLRSRHLAGWSWSPSAAACFAPDAGLMLTLGGRVIGHAGLMHPDLASSWRIYEPVGLAELDLAPVLERTGATPQPIPPPVYPSSTRDIAFIADRAVRHAEIERVIRAAAPADLEQVTLFDVYEGKGIGAGRRSMAYSLTYRSPRRTFTEEEVNGMHQAVVDALVRELKVEIRDSRLG